MAGEGMGETEKVHTNSLICPKLNNNIIYTARSIHGPPTSFI